MLHRSGSFKQITANVVRNLLFSLSILFLLPVSVSPFILPDDIDKPNWDRQKGKILNDNYGKDLK
jgi:hypothetical protein